jgi:Zn-dependent protease with chaperone function
VSQQANELGRIAFNLLVNAAGSFVIAAAVTRLVMLLTRPRPGRWAQAWLALPLIKVLYDIARGIPHDRFFWQTLAGARQDLGSLRVNVGVDGGIPLLDLSLRALFHGESWPQSLAEPLASALVRRVSPLAPAALAGAWLTVSVLLLSARAIDGLRSLRLAHDLRRDARVVATVALGRLPFGLARDVEVAIVVSDRYAGAPFALGSSFGVSRPFVCFPTRVFAALEADERAAVIGHELAHLRQHDLAAFVALAILADVFWCVPGLRARCRTLRAHAEHAADHAALDHGASPGALASALVRVGELCADPAGSKQAPTLSFLAGTPRPSLLGQRVQALLRRAMPNPSPASVRRARSFTALRLAVFAWALVVVLRTATLGNH